MTQLNIINKLIIALDSPNIEDSYKLVKDLGDNVLFYKVGLASLPSGGLELAKYLKKQNKKVFLDLKLYDIGNTIETTVRKLSALKLDFLTVVGDPHIIKSALKGRQNCDLKILAVTVLTSLDRADLDNCLIMKGDVESIVLKRAKLAFESGADGVISAPDEASMIRKMPEAFNKLIVTPGIRPSGFDLNDQKRITTPAKALKSGANHIVVGRPIWQSANPNYVTQKILQELQTND